MIQLTMTKGLPMTETSASETAPDDARELMPDLIGVQHSEPRRTWTRQALELVSSTSEPLTAVEIAAGMNLNGDGPHESTVRSIVRDLQQQGMLHARVESPEERHLRAGGNPRAAAATLFSSTSPVPARTAREVIKGHVLDPLRHPKRTQPKRRHGGARFDLDGAIDAAMNLMLTMPPDRVWMAPELSEVTGVRARDVARRVMAPMVQRGLVKKVKHGGYSAYVLVTADDSPETPRPMPQTNTPARKNINRSPAAAGILASIETLDAEIAKLTKARAQLQKALDSLA